MSNQPDEKGFYGAFGGAYIPEILHENVENLKKAFYAARKDQSFNEEYAALLKQYVGRPSPLYYASRLSAAYGTHIYLKREDLNHTGSHKINNALGQILLAQRMGMTRIIAETGAGQHGVATATACALMGLECVVFMGKTDVERQYLNVQKMRMLGARVEAVTSGNRTLKDATNEAIRYWCSNPDTFYIIGSTVGPHPYPEMVAFFQSVISAEIKQQLEEQTGRSYPDALIACVGGGSNAMGTFYHYIDNTKVQLIAAEAGGKGIDTGETAATLHVGTPGIIHGFKTLLMQDADGQITEPYSISAGLDYPGVGPAHAHFYQTGRSRVYAITDDEALEAALELTRLEGIIPAIESAHALAVLKKEDFAQDDLVVLTVSGRGDKDMDTFIDYFTTKQDF
ncbi:MAG: tryptophan synthase subunit beta [Paludibacter sp.]|nr:tryptophan synthase subunit beta [Paludibacter sp.]